MSAKDTPDVEKAGFVEKDESAAPVAENVGMTIVREVKDADKDGKADPETHTELEVYEVVVERSNLEKINTEVFAYEIPVLMAIHGEHNVRMKEDPEATWEDVEPAYTVKTDSDANDILRILKGKYNSPQGGNVVEQVFRDAKQLASEFGLKLPKGKAKEVPQSENVDKRKPAKKK